MDTGTYRVQYGRTFHLMFYNASLGRWFQDWDRSISAETPERVIKKCRFFKFLLRCVVGGACWGRVGQRALMCAEGRNVEEAEAFVKRNIPGGWEYRFLRETSDSFYLKRHFEGVGHDD